MINSSLGIKAFCAAENGCKNVSEIFFLVLIDSQKNMQNASLIASLFFKSMSQQTCNTVGVSIILVGAASGDDGCVVLRSALGQCKINFGKFF